VAASADERILREHVAQEDDEDDGDTGHGRAAAAVE